MGQQIGVIEKSSSNPGVVRFEANLRWTDFFKVMPTENKRPQQWKITDFNNLMNENPLFDQED